MNYSNLEKLGAYCVISDISEIVSYLGKVLKGKHTIKIRSYGNRINQFGQVHNCNACKSFIRHMGKAVSIDPVTFEVKTFWDDVHSPGYEKTAAD